MEPTNAGAPATPATPAAVPATPAKAATPATGAPQTPATGQPETSAAAPQKYKFKFNVDGQDVEEEYDEESLRSHLQKAKGADKRFNEANDMQQKAARLFQLMKENPWKVLEHPSLWGDKTREQVEKWLWDKVRMEQMDPKEREALQNKEELERLRAERQQQEQAARKQQFEDAKSKFAADIDKDINTALEEAGMLKSAYNMRRCANYMLAALEQGKRVTAKEVIPFVKQDLDVDLRSMFETATEDQILSVLQSDKAWDNIRKADLKRVSKAPVVPAPTGTGQPRAEDGKFAKKPTKADLHIGKRSPFDY